MAWSPYKASVINYVRNHPGCSKWDVASYCTRSARRCPSKQYYIVNTALRHGWITGHIHGNRYMLYVTEEVTLPPGRVVFDSEGGFHVE